MPGPKNERCGDCYYCSSQGGPQITTGKLCRREPPTVVPLATGPGSMQISGQWPPVPIDEWCGEFKLKPQLEKKDGKDNED